MKTKIALFWLLLTLAARAQGELPRMLEIARNEWSYFGQQTIVDGKLTHPGHLESEDPYADRVATYWREGVGFDLSGHDTDQSWSAAFISYVMKTAGLGSRFSPSDWHATYIHQAIQARKAADPSFAFWGYRLSERAPQVGDLVCYAREDGIDFDTQPTTYRSHSDLVVAVRPGWIDVIGGNVADSVTMKTLRTDRLGHLIDHHNKWFAVLAYRP